MIKARLAAVALMALVAAPVSMAQAEVVTQSSAGFVIKLSADTTATQSDAWKALITPSKWWSGEHTYTGDASNLWLDAQATGCFCEKLPKPADAPAEQRMGSVEHMHVVYADPQRGVLRMVGGLGPLQGEALHGTLTITLKPIEGGTRIEWDYVVGGYMRMNPEQIAPLVDKVLGEQLTRLVGWLAPIEVDSKPPRI
ncbi:MAG: SRPBCC family protein [Novosphingobium sp.]|nr:SRPBCC family protein [Novosphingobium sp.]MBP6554297.1 SRPBCC family protein [Novosphingobium sp.]